MRPRRFSGHFGGRPSRSVGGRGVLSCRRGALCCLLWVCVSSSPAARRCSLSVCIRADQPGLRRRPTLAAGMHVSSQTQLLAIIHSAPDAGLWWAVPARWGGVPGEHRRPARPTASAAYLHRQSTSRSAVRGDWGMTGTLTLTLYIYGAIAASLVALPQHAPKIGASIRCVVEVNLLRFANKNIFVGLCKNPSYQIR